MTDVNAWLQERRITEVECLVADQNGVARGKILPAQKFMRSIKDDSLRIPEVLFVQTVTGSYPAEQENRVTDPAMRDVHLRPDPSSLRMVPWYDEPTAQVICDCFQHDGEASKIAPRQVLRRVIDAYEEHGWRPVVAPELEFFLTSINEDPDNPLKPPIGQSRRPEAGSQSYGIEAVNEFDPVFDDVYDWCEAQCLDVDTLIHEGGAAQMEMNFNHGDPLALADQVFLFKRTVRKAALNHEMHATFMAKPMDNQPGSSMHIHQSVVSAKNGQNIFAKRNGGYTRLFMNHIAGLQKHLPAAMLLLAPNVNSYRRLRRYSDAPINLHWGWENRTVGLRVPESGRDARRVENRVAGADANPYLAIAASLACGLLGMTARLQPTKPIEGSAYRLAQTLPRYLPDALDQLKRAKPLRALLGEAFVDALVMVKEIEHQDYQQVVSSWEREHLLLNV
ncbi:MAG: glutamine synthetase family protein [Geminicoccaceae bacterium]